MRFPRLAAALVFLVMLGTPFSALIRTVSGMDDGATQGRTVITQAISSTRYLAVLVVLYGVVVAILWLGRRALIFLSLWESSGLAVLDQPVARSWPARWALALGSVNLVATLLSGRLVVVPEAIVLAGVVFLAMVAGTPPLAEPLPIDPLPTPVIEPEPEITPPHPSPSPLPTTSTSRRITMPWYFRRNPILATATPERFCVEIEAAETVYREFCSRDHSVSAPKDYGRFVRDGLSLEVKAAVRQLRTQSANTGFSPLEEINYVLAFAQRFGYVFDHIDKGIVEYPKFPLEMMWDDRGDCEDHAIIAAACLHLLGYDVRLVLLEYEGRSSGHMALAVAAPDGFAGGSFLEAPGTGRRYYYCEVTTNASTRDEAGVFFRLGEMPESARSAALTLVDVT